MLIERGESGSSRSAVSPRPKMALGRAPCCARGAPCAAVRAAAYVFVTAEVPYWQPHEYVLCVNAVLRIVRRAVDSRLSCVVDMENKRYKK